MHFTSFALIHLISFASLALSAPGQQDSNGEGGRIVTKQCVTEWGPTGAPHSTEWSTTYRKCRQTITKTKTVKSRLPRSTDTVTSQTTTTVTGTTQTETDTTTSTSTIDTTTTSTVVTTTTSTLSTVSTSTVPASAGFLPVQSTLPGSNYDGSEGGDPVSSAPAKKRSPSPTPLLSVSLNTGNNKGALRSGQHQQGVQCWEWREGKCVRITKVINSTKTLPARTTTITTTNTDTTTTNPQATTTTTVVTDSTSTITTFTTSTVTSTSTSFTSTATVYAACARNNLADNIGGQIIGNTNGPPASSIGTFASAYQCCVASLLIPNSQIYLYAPSFTTGGNCFTVATDTCGGQAANQYEAIVGDVGFGQITIGNDNCGEINTSDA